MRQFAKNLVKFAKAEDGPTAVEYAVMLALIIVAVIGAVTTVGTKSSGTFSTTGSVMPSGS
ncbi:MAG TPA: Flp family type IVb pilin [Gemmataceae bacterium]|jgi:pilus assembly protein Flp/PilA|nr:Flp family type IVb pilin [Gemmataceae bacterium]